MAVIGEIAVSRSIIYLAVTAAQPPRKSGSLFEAKQRSELGNNL
jgi:hypothetical protein